ncbi:MULTISPECIES: hypothetical protein [Methylosinus]|nr:MULTISPECIES: hypothetical protein [Methylosinus]
MSCFKILCIALSVTAAPAVGTHRLQASYPGEGAHGPSSRLHTHFVVP